MWLSLLEGKEVGGCVTNRQVQLGLLWRFNRFVVSMASLEVRQICGENLKPSEFHDYRNEYRRECIPHIGWDSKQQAVYPTTSLLL